jgi:ubiquinone/menaquinone biosynthesis C-methylase UbiE/acyl carrier protein
MTIKGSYDIEHVAVAMEQEILRLNAQVDLFWEKELQLYKNLGLMDGMSVLDCGCGPGYLLEKLHNLFPSLQLTGIDVSEPLISYAQKKITGMHLQRCKVMQQSVLSLQFPDESFDFVIVRLVVEHLPDPRVALNEVKRVLKKSGHAIFVDNDFDLHPRTFPDVPEMTDLYVAYCNARIKDGGNPRIGRQLPNLLQECGYSDIRLDLLCAHNVLVGDKAFGKSEGSGIALQLLHDGFLTNDCYERLAVHWSEMLQHPEHAIVRILFAGSGVKSLSDIRSVPGYVTESLPQRQLLQRNLSDHLATGTLSQGLIAAVAETLEIAIETIQPSTPLGNLGLDSVATVMLRNQIENELRIPAPPLDYYHCHSINDLAVFILSQSNKNTGLNIETQENELEEGEI